MIWSGREKHYLLFGRFLTGIGVGGNYMNSLTYLYENAPRKLRSSYLNFYHFMLSTGIMIAYFANQFIKISNWNLIISLGVIFSIL
jgi:MFS family permease